MIKIFKDFDGIISKEEALARGNYEIEYHHPISKCIMYSESVTDGEVRFFSYFMKPDDVESEVLNRYRYKCDRIGIIRRTQHSTLVLDDCREYHNGILKFHSRKLADGNEDTICLQRIDLDTGLPLFEKTSKSFCQNGVQILMADHEDYNKYGDLVIIHYMPTDNEQDWEGFNLNDFDVLESTLGMNLSYFKHARIAPEEAINLVES